MGNNLIKLVQRKMSDESGTNKNRNRTQRNGKSSNGMPVTVSSIENQHSLSSPIFKMNIHCFDEVFEYLSLKDLNSLGQTCKSIQQMTGTFFKRNYSASKFTCLSDGIYAIYPDDVNGFAKSIPIPCFIQLITWIAIGNDIIADYRMRECFYLHNVYCRDLTIKFNYIKLHADELKSVKRLSLTNVRLNRQTVNCILKFLPNIEVLELEYCTVNQNLYDVLLKYCKSLRRLQLIGVEFKNNYKWLLRQYETLENLELVMIYTAPKIDELCTFFERNPSVRSFSCDLFTLWSNKDALLNSKAKLGTFEIIFTYTSDPDLNNCDKIIFTSLWDFVHRLHTDGFYKFLHINIGQDTRCDRLPAMPFLGKLLIWKRESSVEPFLTHFNVCNEIYLDDYWHYNSENEMLVKNLINMELLCLYIEGSVDILLFIQQLRNLKKIKFISFKSVEILKLDLLNTEREKLAGARKVTIYVPDTVYLATKWATKNGATNFSLIEMKRIDLFEWSPFTHVSMPKMFSPKEIKN